MAFGQFEDGVVIERIPTSADRSTLIIGYGNTLRSDDGFGRRAAEMLAGRAPEGMRVVASHQLEIEMAEMLLDCREVVFVDAETEGAAGRLRWRRVGGEPGGEILTHHLTPDALLALARQLWGAAPRAWALTVSGGTFELGEELSPAIEARLPQVVEMLAAAQYPGG